MFNKSMALTLFVSLVCTVGSVWAVVDLQVDIGTDQLHDVKPGWTEWAEPREDPGPVRADETFGDITVVLEVVQWEQNVGLAFRDPDAEPWGGYDGPPLVGDGVMVDNLQSTVHTAEIHMTIVGLAAGNYTMTTWHNYVFDWPSEFVDIEVDGELKVEAVGPTIQVADDEDATTATFEFTAPGDANVVISFKSQQPERNVPLNGFHLVSHSRAREPNPADEYPDACPDVVLSWTAGEFAQPVNGHDVYFGTDYNDVNDATTLVQLGVYKGRQTETDYDPPGLLDWGNTYYWRIDEVNDTDANSPLKGLVWSFTVNNKDNFDPDPEDEATGVSVEATLSWSTCIAGEHKVYFSTDFNDVNERQPAAYKGQQSETNWDPCDMAYLTYYYWAVDKIDGPNMWPGQVWSFETESSIGDPNRILWYEFDETDGNDVPDSSGYQRHGIGDDFDGDTWDPNGGKYDGCINFDGGERVDVPWSTLNTLDDGITVSVWVKGAMGDENYLVSAGDDGNNVWLLIPTTDLKDVEWRAGNDTNDTLLWREADPSAWLDDWHHLGLVKDEIADKMEIYFDGVKVKSKTGTSRALADVGNRWFKIACRWDENDGFNGRVDDFRIYDYALSREQIEALFRDDDVGTAWAPSPSHGQTDVLRQVVLNWRPGNYADSHDVYFGTDWDDVNDADTASGVYVDNREPNEYDPPGSLAFGTTYYWRIDEVNDANGAKWRGKIWQFTAANYIIIDDFEAYDLDTNRIYYTWVDLIGGSTIDLGTEPFSPAHGGDQSMIFVYDNEVLWGSGYYSEAELPFSPSKDFTDGGVKVLTLYFYGDPDNDANDTEELYMALTGSYAEVRYSDDHGFDNNDLRKAEWTEWNVPIDEFLGVDANAVSSVVIGFGDSSNKSTPGGTGVVYFDDIRLYPPRCVPQYGPAYDFSGNCIVDWADVKIMGDEWLR
ncbi:MAG: LamG domain-containing protein, partial [Planctomycetota bacterium]